MALPPALATLATRYKALPRQQQLAVLFGLPAAVFIGFSYLTYQSLTALGRDPDLPTWATRDGGVWSEIASTRNEITQKEQIIGQKAEIEREIEGLKGAIRAAEERLPREAEKSSMREAIERLARDIPPELGTVQFKGVRILEGDDKAGAKNAYRTVTYQTEILGDMNGIIKYIDSIEKNQRFMTVNSINIKAGEVSADFKAGKPAYTLHQVRMDIVTYVYSGIPKPKGAQP